MQVIPFPPAKPRPNQLKAVCVDTQLKVCRQFHVVFDEELPEFRCSRSRFWLVKSEVCRDAGPRGVSWRVKVV